jgi:hypothetical protein
VILTLLSTIKCHLPVNYKYLSVITCNSDFKIFISEKNCHTPVNYKFLSKITYNSDFKIFISGKNCHLPMKVIGSGKEMLGEREGASRDLVSRFWVCIRH